MKVFESLEKRGLIKQITNADKISQLLESESPTTFYMGFDPTADSLHVGHLLQLVTAKRLADMGHNPIMLIGGATASVGDPTGKSEMRQMLDHTTIWVNAEKISAQIKSIMGQDCRIVNNMSWFDGARYLHVIREVGKHFSVNNMLRAECFKSRMENGLSFLEFNYMIMQAIDFNWLFKTENCLLQIGGDDQWSNILAGIDLIHKAHGQEVFGLTLPLLVNSDGTKMGKTEKGAVWLDPKKTSPFEFFQFWRNIPDDKVWPCILFFTSCPPGEINLREWDINSMKEVLAIEVTQLVHGYEAAQQALEQADALFKKRDTSVLEAMTVPDGIHILDLLVKCGFAKSRTDGRNLINNRGITINDEVLTNPTWTLSKSDFNKFGGDVVIRKGKKNFRRLLIEDKCQDQNP
jgi:tyrosyl-tRNA synthetase